MEDYVGGTNTMAKRTDTANAGPESPLRGIKACLDRLHDEASSLDLTLAAVLIGAASEAVGDEEMKNATKPSARTLLRMH